MRRYSRFVGLLTIVLLGATLVGCSSSKSSSSASGGQSSTSASGSGFTPLSADTLTIATNLPAPGFFNGNDVDHLNGGLEYGIAVELAKRLGLSKGVKVNNVSFDGLVAGQAGGFDLAFSQVTITSDRAKVVDFSVPYFSSDQGIMVNKGTKVPDATAAKALQWGVQQSTTGQSYLTDTLKPKKEPRVYSETTQAFTALQAKQIDAVLLDTAIVLQQASQSGSPFEVVGQFKTGESYGAILPKGSKNLAAVNRVLQSMLDDGTIGRLTAQYLGADPSKIPVISPS